MLTYRIFLASSAELKPDRLEFEVFIARLNDELHNQNKHVRFELKIWERVDNAIYDSRKQDQYNVDLDTCDLFVLLYWTKIGRFSEEEFDRAYKRFIETGKPKIYTYKKTTDQSDTVIDASRQSLTDFDKKLNEAICHFTDTYQTGIELTAKFKTEIDKLFASGYLQYGQPAICLSAGQSAVPATFIGREKELKVIRERLDQGGKLLLINAEGGMGKTSIAAKYWQESLYQYNYNAWLFCENGIVEEIKKLAPKLNVDLAQYKTEKEQLLALKTALENTPGDCLLVLDNANNPNDIQVFRQYFEGIHWHVLFTSRCKGVLPNPNTTEYQIEHLPPNLALDLFRHNYEEDNPSFKSKLDQLLKAIGYNTLLIDLFSKNLKQSAALGDNLESFLNRLESGGLLLKERSFEVITDYTTHHQVKQEATTDEIIEAIYDLTKLEEAERYWLVNLSLMPAVNHTLKVLIDLFMPEDGLIFKKILDKLAKYGWLITDIYSYRISPVIQIIVLEKSKTRLTEDSKKLIEALNYKLANDGTYLINLKEQEAQAFAEIGVHCLTILKNTLAENVGSLCYNLIVFYTNTGDILNALKYAEEYKQRNEKTTDKNNIAVSYSKLGDIYSLLGNLDKALTSFEDCSKLSEEIYDANPNDEFKNNLAISYCKLGDAYTSLGNLGKAISFFEKYLHLTQELFEINKNSDSFKNSLAIANCKLGESYLLLANLYKAIVFFTDYSKLESELHNANPKNVSFKDNLAISYLKLGECHTKLGNLDAALDFFNDFYELANELYNANLNNVSFKNSLAISYCKLGETCTSLGKLDDALSFFENYLKLSKELHDAYPNIVSYKNGLAISYSKLGDHYLKNMENDKARSFFQSAEIIWTEIANSFPDFVEYNRNLKWVREKLQ